MGPQGFKKMDKRHFHVKDVADVIEWFAYRASRDEEALKVIKTLRNSHNTQSSMIKGYQRKEKADRERYNLDIETPLASGAPGELQSVDQPSKAAQDEAILSELQELLDDENEVRKAKEEVELTDEHGKVDASEYSVFYVKDSPRFKKGNVMVKAIDVPEAVKAALLAEKPGGES